MKKFLLFDSRSMSKITAAPSRHFKKSEIINYCTPLQLKDLWYETALQMQISKTFVYNAVILPDIIYCQSFNSKYSGKHILQSCD